MAIGDSACPDRRMQMKSHSKLIRRLLRDLLAPGWEEKVLTIEPVAVWRQDDRSLVHVRKSARITIVGRTHDFAFLDGLTLDRHVGGAGDDRVDLGPPATAGRGKPAR